MKRESNTSLSSYRDFPKMLEEKQKNFFIGCAIFLAIAVVLGCFCPFYVSMKTRDQTQKKCNAFMACGLVYLAVFYMWLSWSTYYQAQLYPYYRIEPTEE